MLKRITLLLFLIVSAFGNLNAQKTAIYTNSQQQYDKAFMLYRNELYAAAQLEFEELKKNDDSDDALKITSEYYASLCSIKLGEKNGDNRMKDFVENNPTSVHKNQAIIDISDYYYNKGQYSEAKKWLNKVDPYDLDNNSRDEFLFKKAYVSYYSKDYDSAKVGFTKVFSSKKYSVEAKYYYAHIAYLQKNNSVALKYFDEVKDDKRFAKQVPFFITQIYFNQKKYEKAIAEGTPLLKNRKSKQFSNLSKLIGECYFNIGDYENALPHLLNYKGNKGKYDNTHFYQLGFVYYQNGEYEKAISYFNKIIKSQTEVAQNAYYNLAGCYLKLNKKSEALNAFRSASDLDFDKKLKEDALYNYARLSYEVGNVAESSSKALNRYLKAYPNSIHKNEIFQLLVESYMTSNDYAEVLQTLDSLNLTTYKMKVLYQKSAYLLGVQHFNNERYKDANSYFDLAIKNGYDDDFRAKSKYWKAETDYRLGNFNDALIGYQAYKLEDPNPELKESKMLPYNIGYVQFKLNNYDEAIINFQLFLKNGVEDTNLKNDTYLRLGDSYFVNRKYWPALENYNLSLRMKVGEEDYAIYQKAVCYGLMGKNDNRIEALNTLLQKYPESTLQDDAMYLLGRAYTLKNENVKALEVYSNLEKKYPNSSYTSKAKLKIALIYYNSNKNEKALAEYKDVVEKYPSTYEAKQAVAGSRKIYIDMGKASEYVSWVKTLDFIDISQTEADSTSYLAGEKAFLRGDCDKAIPSFNNYLKEFPKGISRINANFYLAQCEYKIGDYKNAIKNFEEVLKVDNNEFTERTLVRASGLYMQEADTVKAISTLERLLSIAEFQQNKTYSEINLMHLYNGKGDLDKALESASIVVINSKVSDKVKSEARLIIARGAMAKGDMEIAKANYKKIQKTGKGEVVAEAMYYDAYFLNLDKKYEKSNEVIFEVASKFSMYKYWGAKSLVIMAKNFDALNDQYQAIYTLETVINNFDYEEVKLEAQTLLDEISSKSLTEVDSTSNSIIESDTINIKQ
jgi:TolA-binding protein